MKKKLLLAVTALLLCTVLALPVFAEKGSMEDLVQKWNTSGYPNYVCGVWGTYEKENGTKTAVLRLNVSLLPGQAGEDGKEEILSQIRDGESVTFHVGQYSHNALLSLQDRVMEQARTMLGKGYGCACGLLEEENRLEMTIFLGGKEKTEDLAGIVRDLQDLLGDKGSVGLSDGKLELLSKTEEIAPGIGLHLAEPVSPTDAVAEITVVDRRPLWLLWLLPPVLIACAWLLLRRRAVLLPVEGTAQGTDGDVEEALRDLAVSPPPSLDTRILSEITEKGRNE